jgi:hypothetical protein
MPEILKSGDKRFKEVVDYLEEITRSQGIDTEFTVIGDEVVLV